MGEVVVRARQAVAARDFTVVTDLLETQPLELWYGVPTAELGAMLTAIPPDALRRRGSAQLVVTTFFLPEPDQIHLDAASAADPRLRRWRAFYAGWRARTSGDVMGGYELMRALPDTLSSELPPADPANGLRAFYIAQTALSAALAGEFRDALALYERMLQSMPAHGLEFLAREAHLRSALIHGLHGDRHVAGLHHRQALAIPRTSSWVESRLDLEDELVWALLMPEEDAAVACDQVLRLTYRQMGELWPFYVGVLRRLAIAPGRRPVVRERLEALRAAGLGQPPGNGYTGSVLGQVLALDALMSGNVPRAKAELATADDGWRTQLIGCLLAIVSSAPRGAIQTARALVDQTRGLQQAEQQRVLILALAYYADGDEGEALALLESVASEIGPDNLKLVNLVSASLAQLAIERVPGWPAGVEPMSPGVMEAPRLTASELGVLTELSRGSKRRQIARALFLSENTVKTHQRSLYRKLGVGTAGQAVLEATRRGMI